MFSGDFTYLVETGGIAENLHGQNGFCLVGNTRFDLGIVDIQTIRVNINEDRRLPAQQLAGMDEALQRILNG